MSISTANVTTSVSNVFNNSTASNVAITWLSLCNYGASDVAVNVYIVPSGGTPGNTNIVLTQLVLTSSSANAINNGDTYQIYSGSEKILLGVGDSISAVANANTVTAVTSYTTI